MQIDAKSLEQIERNPFFTRYAELGIRESFFSDTVGAVGNLQTKLVACAEMELIGRKIIQVQSTKLPSERWPVDTKTVAYRYAQGSCIRLSGSKPQVVEINADITAQAAGQWTKEFLEDYLTLRGVDSIVQSLSMALAIDETKHVVALYGGIEDEDLAGGEPVDQQNKMMDWNAVGKLRDAVRGEH